MPPGVHPSWPLVLGFHGLAAALVAVSTAWAGRGALGLCAILGGAAAVGATVGDLPYSDTAGVQSLVVLTVLLGGAAGWAEPALRTPPERLVAFQTYRLFWALLVHRAVAEGIAPDHQARSPLGLDVNLLVGGTAPFMAFAVRWVPPAFVQVWNLGGLLAVAWTAAAIALSVPPMKVLEPHGAWVVHLPFVWGPSLFVACGLGGHVALHNRLRSPLPR